MTRMWCSALLVGAFTFFLTCSAIAQTVVYEQPPSPSGGIIPSSWVDPNGSDSDMYSYESFILTSDQDITEVRWRGGNSFGAPYGGVFDFTIAFYESIAGGSQPHVGNPQLPDIYLAFFDVGGTASPTPAGTYGGVAMYDYRFVLPAPFHAVGGAKYWVKIEASQAGYPDWGLAAGIGPDSSHFEFSTGLAMFFFGSGDTAFSLVAASGNSCAGTVDMGPGGAGPVDVLKINGGGGGGGLSRVVELHPSDPLLLAIEEPPSRVGRRASYAVYAWLGEPVSADATVLPRGIGTTCMPTPITPAHSPQPNKIANNIGSTSQLGVENWPGRTTQRAPYNLLNLPNGLGPSRVGLHLFFQGIIQDDRSAGTVRFSVTNGMVLRIIP